MHPATGVGLRFYIWSIPGFGHVGALGHLRSAGAGILLVAIPGARHCVLEFDRLDHGKRIRFAGRGDPGELRFEFAFLHRQCPLEDTRGDRSRDGTAVLPALHHDHDGVTRVIVRREAAKPGDGVLLPVQHRLRGAGFACDLHVFHTRDAARAAVFVHHFPKAVSDDLDLLRSKFVPEISVHFGRRRNGDLAVGIQHR